MMSAMEFATRQVRIGVINALAVRAVFEELHVLMDDVEHDDADWPDGYLLDDAFDDLAQRVDDNLSDFSTSFICCIRDIYIALGDYREITEEELSRTIVSAGRAYSFKHKGKKYVYAD